MSDKNFMQHNTKIVSASPYRAVVRRQDPPYQLQQTSRDDSDDEDDNDSWLETLMKQVLQRQQKQRHFAQNPQNRR